MTPSSALRQGLETARRTYLLALFLVALNLALSLTAAIPLYHALDGSFGRSQTAERMVKGFDYLWWEQFRHTSRGAAQTFGPAVSGRGAILENLESLVEARFLGLPPEVLSLVFLYLLVRTLAAGGILGVYGQSPTAPSLSSFLQGAGRNFGAFFLLLLTSAGFFYLVLGIVRPRVSALLQGIAARSYSEIPQFISSLIFNLVTLFLLLFIHMVFDYARVDAALSQPKNFLRSIGRSISFVSRRLGPSLRISYAVILSGVPVSLVYVFVSESLPQENTWGVLAAFLAQETFIFLIAFLRCWLYSSQTVFYRSTTTLDR